MNEVLKTKRAQKKRERAGAHQSCNLFITNHDGRKNFLWPRELEYKYR
jgi:phage-related protein